MASASPLLSTIRMLPPESSTPAWNDQLLASPHTQPDKRTRVQKMFAAIAPSYDMNNRLHSLWMDQKWRRKAVRLANLKASDVVVDVACGTGDLTLEFLSKLSWLTAPLGRAPLPSQVLGIDFTFQMLPIARRKLRQQLFPYRSRGEWNAKDPYIDQRVRSLTFVNGDALSLPLPDASADVASIAFGIRNVQDPLAALREFHRVLRPEGVVIVLEFSLPTNRALRGLYNFYFRKILPRTATLISRDKTGAYKYLPESVNTFIGREQMVQMLRDAGFERIEQFPLTFGVCVCYRGYKP
jgi:demethylmenaquinone methyltransferase / 2-methoxy-6-polyprenyl-1,4-benzoquinol methylase